MSIKIPRKNPPDAKNFFLASKYEWEKESESNVYLLTSKQTRRVKDAIRVLSECVRTLPDGERLSTLFAEEMLDLWKITSLCDMLGIETEDGPLDFEIDLSVRRSD